MALTGKTIGELALSTGITSNSLFAIEQSGFTFHIPYSGLSSPNIEDITYSNLYSKVVNGELTPGQWYRLTDYRSVNFLNGWNTAYNDPTPTDPNFIPREIYTGETEVLILQAISEYEISQIGYSETFPGDIIQYEPYTNKIGVLFNIQNGNTLPDSSTVSGFDLQWDGTNVYFEMPTGYPALFGHYFYIYCSFSGGTYTQNGIFEPLTPNISVCQYPYSNPKPMSRLRIDNNGTKVVLLDLDVSDYNAYDLGTLNVETIYEIGNSYGWITRRQDTFKNVDVPFDFRGRKYRRFEVDLSSLNANLGTGYYGIGDDYLGQGTTGTYQDFKCFGENGYNYYNIIWSDMGGPELYNYRGYNDNFVCLGDMYHLKINEYCYENTVNSNFTDNTIGTNFNNNTIGSNFSYNVVDGSFSGNLIAGGFSNNKIDYGFASNSISNNFYLNEISTSFQSNKTFGQFTYNTIGGSFINNISIGNNFSFNKIGYGFQNNLSIGNDFTNNTIGNNFSNNPTIGNGFTNNTIGNDSQSNTIGELFNSNTIGNDFQSNTIGDNILSNTIGELFNSNTIGNDFQSNTIGDNFNNNTIDINFNYNTIGNIFNTNTIGNNFTNNTIGFNFGNNTIGTKFNNNTIGNVFYNNTTGTNFRFNTIKYEVNSINFSSATYVYANYNCEIFRRSDGTLRLSYYDSLDVLNITNIDA